MGLIRAAAPGSRERAHASGFLPAGARGGAGSSRLLPRALPSDGLGGPAPVKAAVIFCLITYGCSHPNSVANH